MLIGFHVVKYSDLNRAAKNRVFRKALVWIPTTIIVVFLLISSVVIQLKGGQGNIPTWQALRSQLGIPLAVEDSVPASVEDSTAVYVLSVGQGDAVLIRQDSSWCLIDTGPADAEGNLVYDLQSLGVSTLDYLVLTHPHADHTGNARAVVQNFSVEALLIPSWEPSGEITSDWPTGLLDDASSSGTVVHIAQEGQSYPLGSGTLQILQGGMQDESSTDSDNTNVNNISLCALFTAGDFRFLDTGDAEAEAEQQLVDRYGPSLHAVLFKAGHHGSYTSNSIDFLELVQPQAVAISCGLNNDYGHPHKAALQNYAQIGAEIYRTDQQGSLTFTWRNGTLYAETTANAADIAA